MSPHEHRLAMIRNNCNLNSPDAQRLYAEAQYMATIENGLLLLEMLAAELLMIVKDLRDANHFDA